MTRLRIVRLARTVADQHPWLVTWLILAVGMVAMLLFAARDVLLLPGQRAALVVATIALAGACVWILRWD
ncbi:MAG: hypothetical protein HYY04_18640 [Chloroflexi bacterium]|nr:hypothetical protein [Chloroflexota bacterium]